MYCWQDNYSREAIKQDFAAGIKELDQELAEEEDAANFNPEEEVRDYDEVAASLPVFCVSSRGYQKLMGRFKKDKPVLGFTAIEATEIPALQVHCSQLTESNREAACKTFLNSLNALLNSLRLWSSSDGTSAHLTDDQLRREKEILEGKLGQLDTVRSLFGLYDPLFALFCSRCRKWLKCYANYRFRPSRDRSSRSQPTSSRNSKNTCTRSSQQRSKLPRTKHSSRKHTGVRTDLKAASHGRRTKLWCVVMESTRMLRAYIT